MNEATPNSWGASATPSYVVSVIGFVTIPIILGPIAWVLANRAAADGDEQAGGARILAIVVTIVGVAHLVLIGLILGLVDLGPG